MILTWYHLGQKALKENVSFNKITSMNVLEKIGRMKYIKEDDFNQEAEKIFDELNNEFEELMKGDELYV
jgi:V/A-type H+-transporting ATPase subunit A